MNYEDTIWVQAKAPLWETDRYGVFEDAFPVTPGHLLFVPKTTAYPHGEGALQACFGAAMTIGLEKVRTGVCQSFNVGYNHGPAAGQTIPYPHVHLILRYDGDCADPIGGVRGVIPGQANYKTAGYRQPE